MAYDQAFDGVAEKLGNAFSAPLDRESLKTVSAYTPLGAPPNWNCVHSGLLRDRAVELLALAWRTRAARRPSRWQGQWPARRQ